MLSHSLGPLIFSDPSEFTCHEGYGVLNKCRQRYSYRDTTNDYLVYYRRN